MVRFSLLAATIVLLLVPGLIHAQVPFTIQGPGVDPNDFRITEFATGLNFPVGMVELDDGSLLVATSNGSGLFSSTSGSLIRLADTNGDGTVDVTQTLVNNVPGGKLTALRRSGDLIFTTGQGNAVPISIYRLGAQPSDPLTLQGSLNITYPGGWQHPHSALVARPTPGVSNSHDLFFQVGSQQNFQATTQTLSLTSNIGSSGTVAADAIQRVQITDLGNSVSGSSPLQIASGVRNAAGMAFHPTTGDLYFQDNGIDGLVSPIEPTSADEINVIPAADIGGSVEDFGFPSSYVEYRTNNVIGSGGIQPLVAIQPIPAPNGAEAEGANDIAFAPESFPAALRNGIFVGFHGQFFGGGIANEENPVAFVDLNDNSYFHFIGNDVAGVGHLDGLLSTADSLFLADISPTGGLGSGQSNSGKIYQIQATLPPPTADADGDGDVDGLDFLILQQSSPELIPLWEATYSGTTPVAAVPEPSSAFCAVACLLWRFSKRQRSVER